MARTKRPAFKRGGPTYLGPDLISELPETIREKILSYLPIKEAGRTSVLSSTWRFTWSTKSEIVIDELSGRVVPVVDAILRLHNGPIHKFHLSSMSEYVVDMWIEHLSQNGIKELSLKLDHPIYEIPACLFSCDNLTSVSLANCRLKFPADFKGFKFLHTLSLVNFMGDLGLSSDCIKKFVSGCPLLENLRLLYSGRYPILDIQAPNLKEFIVYGNFTTFRLCSPKLISLEAAVGYCLGYCRSNSGVGNQSNKSNIEQVFGLVPNLEKLVINSFFLQFLAKGHVAGKFPMIFQKLKKLYLKDINFEDKKNMSAFLFSLLQSTPNLELLDIKISTLEDDPTHNFWESLGKHDFSLKHLQLLDCGFTKAIYAAPFLKFMLSCAPQLLELTLLCWKVGKEEVSLKQYLLQLPRASAKAQIFIKYDF